jgi:hypothetical protein
MAKNLRVRKLADKTGEPLPDGTWPFAGLEVEHAPKTCRVSTTWVRKGQNEGWLEVENERPVLRPSGPADDPWRGSPHVFNHVDAVVLKTIDGDVRYRVTRQPDKYAVSGDEDSVTPDVYAAGDTQVDWFYELKLEG